MTDEEAMEALLNSGGYSFPTWTLTLGLPTYEMRDVMSLIASDKGPIPGDATFISGYLHMDGAVVESSVKELLDRRLVYRRGSYLIPDLEMCDRIYEANVAGRKAKVAFDIGEASCPPIPLAAMRAGEVYPDSSLIARIVSTTSLSCSGWTSRMSRTRLPFGVKRVWLIVRAAHSLTKSV